nr:MAG TPA: hypothetical protein [Bacteriophage sp.]
MQHTVAKQFICTILRTFLSPERNGTFPVVSTVYQNSSLSYFFFIQDYPSQK